MKKNKQKELNTKKSKVDKYVFACPSCSSKRDKDSEECPRCRTSLAAVQIHPTPTVFLSKEEARQILIARSMTQGISRMHKGKQSAAALDDDYALTYY